MVNDQEVQGRRSIFATLAANKVWKIKLVGTDVNGKKIREICYTNDINDYISEKSYTKVKIKITLNKHYNGIDTVTSRG